MVLNHVHAILIYHCLATVIQMMDNVFVVIMLLDSHVIDVLLDIMACLPLAAPTVVVLIHLLTVMRQVANVFALQTHKVDDVIHVQIQHLDLIVSLGAKCAIVMLLGLGHPSATCKQDSVSAGHM
jgi:hypothetical protein